MAARCAGPARASGTCARSRRRSAPARAAAAAHAPAASPAGGAAQRSRRDALLAAGAAGALFASGSARLRADAATDPPAVVVLGGTGFVGSRVVALLAARGVAVTSVSRKGAPADGGVPGVSYVAADVSDTAALAKAVPNGAAVVSCVGVIGTSDDEAGNGAANVSAAAAAKQAGASRFVYVSVASLVADTVDGIALGDYFKGKREAEAAVIEAFGDAVVLRPSFVYGGDAFSVAPPRVPSGYGGAVEGLLSAQPIRAVAGVSPGLVKLTLAPPVSVDAVAGAAAAAALGAVAGGVVDGTDAINAAAKALTSA